MNRKLVIAAIAATTLAVGGTTAAIADGSDDTPTPSGNQSQSDDMDDKKSLSDSQLTAKEAIDKALASVDGKVSSIELDDEDGGRLAWDADVLGDDGKWHELTIDADNGKVTQHPDDDADDKNDRDDD